MFTDDSDYLVPLAVMVKEDRLNKKWLLPEITIHFSNKKYRSYFTSECPLMSMQEVIYSALCLKICLSFETDEVASKLLLFPYRAEFNLDNDDVVDLSADEIMPLHYLHYLENPTDGEDAVLSFKDYVEHQIDLARKISEFHIRIKIALKNVKTAEL
jgi:hypothetical protein